MKKTIVAAVAVYVLFHTAKAVETQRKQLDFSLSLGYASSLLDSPSFIPTNWSMGAYTSIIDETMIKAKARAGWLAASSLSFYFTRNIGIQTLLGYMTHGVAPASDFFFSYFRSGVQTNHNEKWSGSGIFSAIPLSLNFILGRLGTGRLRFYISAGATLFLNSLEARASGGVSIYRAWGEFLSDGSFILHETLDALRVPVVISKTRWRSGGGNIGGGMTFRFSKAVGLLFEFRYFYCPKKSFSWRWTPADYAGLYHNIDTVTYIESWAEAKSLRTPALNINPSLNFMGSEIYLSF